jgi:hypothetical protein
LLLVYNRIDRYPVVILWTEGAIMFKRKKPVTISSYV